MREREKEETRKQVSKFCYVHVLGCQVVATPCLSSSSLSRRLFVVEVRRVETSTSSASTSFKGYRYPVRLTQGKRQPTKKTDGIAAEHARLQECRVTGLSHVIFISTTTTKEKDKKHVIHDKDKR